MTSSARHPLAAGLCVMLFLACFAWMLLQSGGQTFLRDRWWRNDLADRFPPGASSHGLQLVNAGSLPTLAEVRNAGWDEPRLELLLPGQSQVIVMPADPAHPTVVRMRTLDLQARDAAHVVELPAGWVKTFIKVDGDGAVSLETRPGGDYSPKRGYVAVDSAYPLPVRVELPFDAHERPTGKDYERHAWIGPGVRWDSAQCAYALERTPSVLLWVPRPTAAERVLEVGAADRATRLTMTPDGTVVRDTIPAWRQLAELAASL
ncbi:MAG TPA: hypothetical protein VFD43_01460 [Planctomycetota bacterium]|nr:hypothetical protein [Planctomycetota bacterium]